MTISLEAEPDCEILTSLDASDDAAIERATSVVDVGAQQHNQSYKEHRRRSQLRRSAELEAFEQARERIRRIKRGWPAISERELAASNFAERKRARWARNKRDFRARKVKPGLPAPAISPVVMTRKSFDDRVSSLRRWLALPGHRQRHLRGREADILRTWTLFRDHVSRHLRGPTLREFAEAFEARFRKPLTRQMAQKRLKLLASLEAACGPWSGL
jgi:hypothetical protein